MQGIPFCGAQSYPAVTGMDAKHVSKGACARLAGDRETIQEPQWWHARYHAVPGGNVIIQEETWGSIITFTLRVHPSWVMCLRQTEAELAFFPELCMFATC
jgi:hypothetical protein